MIYAVDFKIEIFDRIDIIDDFINFLNRDDNNKISIIIQNSKLLKQSRTFYKKLEDYINNDKITFQLFNEGRGGRFMVLGNAYRQAKNVANVRDFGANVNLNDPDKSQKLKASFEYAATCSTKCIFQQ
jgi:hypothetical protein